MQSASPVPPLNLKAIMSFILCLTKKEENSICVSITLRDAIMMATKWLLSRWGGRDNGDESSTGAPPTRIIGVRACVRVSRRNEERLRVDKLSVGHCHRCRICQPLSIIAYLVFKCISFFCCLSRLLQPFLSTVYIPKSLIKFFFFMLVTLTIFPCHFHSLFASLCNFYHHYLSTASTLDLKVSLHEPSRFH